MDVCILPNMYVPLAGKKIIKNWNILNVHLPVPILKTDLVRPGLKKIKTF